MRFLRNPIVTGVLTLLAVATVFYRFVLPYLSSPGVPLPGTPAPAPSPVAAKAVATASALRDQLAEAAAPWRGPKIDREYVEGRFAKWVATPKRDPFLLMGVDPKNDKELQELLEPSPIAKWKLNAIWSQTGSRLAVVNNRVHQVGDEIAGFKIIRIEADEVWFQGPKRKERLGLLNRGPAVLRDPGFQSITNRPASSSPSTSE
jgi:hypothetical protein